MKMPKSKWALSLQVMALVLCVGLVFSGGYPPAHAQGDSAGVQTEQIRELREKQARMDERMSKQWDKVTEVDTQITHLYGMIEGFGALFTLLLGGSITLQVRKSQ